MKLEGKLFKFYLVRIQGYIGNTNFIMLLYSVVIIPKLLGWDWYIWIGLLSLILPTLLFYDLKYVYPREIKLSYEVNKKLIDEFDILKKDTKQLKKDITEIKKLIKEKL